jgi:hypothetical protein
MRGGGVDDFPEDRLMPGYNQLMPDYYGDITKAYDQGRERKQKNNLASLEGQYFAGQVAPEQQAQFQGEVAQQGGDAASFRKDAMIRAAQHAMVLQDTPDDLKPQVYSQVVREFRGAGFALPPQADAYDPSHLPMLAKFAQTVLAVPGKDVNSPMNVSPGGEIVDPRTGKVIHANMNFAPARPFYDAQRGMMIYPDQQGGQQATPSQQRVQFDFTPDMPQAAQDAARAAAGVMDPGAQEVGPQMGGGGMGARTVQVAPPMPQKPNYEGERIAMERERLAMTRADHANSDAAPAQDEVDFYAQMSNAGDYSWATGMARGKSGQALIAAVRKRQVELAGGAGMAPQDVTANRASSTALQKTLVDRQKYASAVQNLNGTLDRQAALVESLLSKGAANGQSPVLNRWIQAGRKQIAGDGDVNALDTAIRGLGREHQRVLTGPLSNAQLQQGASETADQLVNISMNPDAIRKVIGVMKAEARNGLEQNNATLEDLRNQLRGMNKTASAKAPEITTQSQYDALPKGAIYTEDGKQYKKP